MSSSVAKKFRLGINTMFDQLGSFEPVYPRGGGGNSNQPPRPPLRRARKFTEYFVYYAANAIILPVVAIIYATIIAEGLRQMMPLFQMRLYKLAIPGAGFARDYDGLDRLDLAILMSLLLFVVVTWLWGRVFMELQGLGSIAARRHTQPIVFYFLSFIAFTLIVGDASIFYVGLASQGSSGWSETPFWVAPGATILYTCGLAIIGWWHSDWKTSNLV